LVAGAAKPAVGAVEIALEFPAKCFAFHTRFDVHGSSV
jgi:hypothetical protein